MTNRNIQKRLIDCIFLIIAFFALENVSYAACFNSGYNSQLYITTGDFHLHGKPKNIQAWSDGGIKIWTYTLTFDVNSRIQSIQRMLRSRCDYIYTEKNLSEIKINNTGLNEMTISASHLNALGEPDIFVRKIVRDNGFYISSSVANLIMVSRPDGKVLYSTYEPVNDKPLLVEKTITSYHSDGLLKTIDFIALDDTLKEISNISHSTNYRTENGTVVQQDMMSRATGLAINTMKFEEFEFDACKNWTRRKVLENSINSKTSYQFVETREITYHTPCE